MKLSVRHIDPLITKDDIKIAEAEVGIFGNALEPKAKKSLKSFAGNNAMGIGGKSGIPIREVAELSDERYKWFDYTTSKTDKDLVEITNRMGEVICKFDDRSIRRYKNALTAWLRNPIMNRKFGMNNPRYVRWKGFDWVMVRTGAMFKNIKARLISEE